MSEVPPDLSSLDTPPIFDQSSNTLIYRIPDDPFLIRHYEQFLGRSAKVGEKLSKSISEQTSIEGIILTLQKKDLYLGAVVETEDDERFVTNRYGAFTNFLNNGYKLLPIHIAAEIANKKGISPDRIISYIPVIIIPN